MEDRSTNAEVSKQFFASAVEFPAKMRKSGLLLDIDVYLVTPMFGGGPRPGYPDPITPFRGTSIRGQLRFWWRATRGAAYKDSETLRLRESQIWGSSDRSSPVRIRVECPPEMKPKARKLSEIARDFDQRYALFPAFEGKSLDHDSPRLLEGGGFKLRLSLSDAAFQDDLNAALWAWLNFGGLGARTRRGLGALFCPQFAGWDASKFAGDGSQREWPILKGGELVLGEKDLAWKTCWLELLNLYRNFRQDRSRNGQGASTWPEATEIRRIRQDNQKPGPAGFPRSALGLPIVFHFKGYGQPPGQTLYPSATESPGQLDRMASPVIIRPWAIAPGKAKPLILRLKTDGPKRLLLTEPKNKDVTVQGGQRDAIEELLQRAYDDWSDRGWKARRVAIR